MNRKTFLTSVTLLAFIKGLGAKSMSFIKQTCKTQKDYEGPFYKSGSPIRSLIETNGTPLTITGVVLAASDCKTPVTGAIIDIWHCDDKGKYDNDGFTCRGMVKSDRSGAYTFRTIYPPPYDSRPRHIHFKVRARGYPELTSQIYFKGDPNISNDFARNAESGRVIEVTKQSQVMSGVFNIYI